MKIHRIWASVIGFASFTIGLLRFFLPSLGATIPPLDGVIHIVTGAGFISGAWLYKGSYVNKTNGWLGAFYIVFGIIGSNWPHIIMGAISLLLGLFIKIKRKESSVKQLNNN